MRLWPKSLTGQVILLLLLALVASQVLTFFILGGERHRVLRERALEDAVGRTLSVVKLVVHAPPAYLPNVLQTASQGPFLYRLEVEPLVTAPGRDAEERNLEADLTRALASEGIDRVHARLVGARFAWFGAGEGHDLRTLEDYENDDDHEDDDDHKESHIGERDLSLATGHHLEREEEWRHRRIYWRGGLALSMRLQDGQWLNLQAGLLDRPAGWGLYVVLSLILSAAVMILVVVVALRRITRPLRALTRASEAYGRGEKDIDLSESGPEDMRRTISAFNRMRERLDRYVRDRTQMLAAVSHDLRTPVTTLRLRAEFIDNPEIQAKILETLDDMTAMIEAILAYTREESAREDTRRLDLAAVLQCLCADLADQGYDIAYDGPERLEISARPLALKRAFANLMENAVRYGKRAQVALECAPDGLTILIDDEGPGIAAELRERVFEPFFRVEASRSADTGGIGMGLAIARSVLRGHGGDITLEESPKGGLRQRIWMPLEPRRKEPS